MTKIGLYRNPKGVHTGMLRCSVGQGDRLADQIFGLWTLGSGAFHVQRQ